MREHVSESACVLYVLPVKPEVDNDAMEFHFDQRLLDRVVLYASFH